MDLMLNAFAQVHRKEFEATQPEILRTYSKLNQKKRDMERPAHIQSLPVYMTYTQASGRPATTPDSFKVQEDLSNSFTITGKAVLMISQVKPPT